MPMPKKIKEELHLVEERARRMFRGLRGEQSRVPSPSQDSVSSINPTPAVTAAATSSLPDLGFRSALNDPSSAMPGPVPPTVLESEIITPVSLPVGPPQISLGISLASDQDTWPAVLPVTVITPAATPRSTTAPPIASSARELPATIPPTENSTSHQSPAPGPVTGHDPITPTVSNQSGKKMVWAGFKTFMGVLNASADAFGPLKSAVGGISECIDIYEKYAQGREDYATLEVELASLFGDLAGFFSGSTPPVMTANIDNLAKGIQREVNFVKEKGQRNKMERVAEAKEDPDAILQCYRRVRDLLARLGFNANLNTWKTVDEMATENRLKSLPFSPSAKYKSSESANIREGCTPNTRIAVLKQLRTWAYDAQSENIYWLNGMAGTGKTTIAYSLCDVLKDAQKLAASFFCSRQLPECRNVNRILPTICYQLALFSRPFRYAISRVLEEDPDVHNQPLRQQFEKLILEPLLEVKKDLPVDRIVVIDALDECEDETGVGQILEILLQHAPNLPVKFFVTSRPEPEINIRMLSRKGERAQFELYLHDLERSIVQEDIRLYLQSKLERIDLSVSDLERLVQQSGVLFIYASTVVRYIGVGSVTKNPRKRLATILSVSLSTSSIIHKDIDKLYTTIIEAALKDPNLEQSEGEEMKLVLDSVICAQEPLTVPVLARMLKLDGPDSVRSAIQPLLSVLHVSGAEEQVTTLHASFPDYMFNQSRSGLFHCNAQRHNAKLANLCFDMIGTPDPPFNICNLRSSYVLDDAVPDLDDLIKKVISDELFYACRYWGSHLELAESSDDLLYSLDIFLSVRLLLWMEIMNLKRCMHVGARLLDRAHRWIQSADCSNDVRALCRDSFAFFTAFSSSPASRSTPHIYVSALPFWPAERAISRCYVGKLQGLVNIRGTALVKRNSAPLVVYNTGSRVYSVALSPDGSRLAFGCEESTMQILNAHTGQLIDKPFEGHTDEVNSVAYSVDNGRIVSGSDDNTVRIWDSLTGLPIGRPLGGHTSLVRSVAFSGIGAYIASGSGDCTIRLWDANTGQSIGEPLQGHTETVYSVAFSADATAVASGSADKTIRIWDVRTGQMIGEPLEGHTGGVNSIAFSGADMIIVSGSDDCTIRIWDAHSGQPVDQPLEGHTGSVKSVVCSEDGALIVSGSKDKTIRIWNAHTRKMIGSPLEGHTEAITSLALSSDGARIVSGSKDTTIRIWDAHARTRMGELPGEHTDVVTLFPLSSDASDVSPGSDGDIAQIPGAHTSRSMVTPFQDHTGQVYSVAYSSDGNRIVSGSEDGAVRIWDARTGQMIGSPLMGHIEPVVSVLFSSDDARIISGSEDRSVRIWNAHTGQSIGEPLQGHRGAINSIALSSDGERIVSSSEDNTMRIWDAHTGKLIGEPLTGHTDPVYSVAISGDCARIVSGSNDQTIRIWDAHTGNIIGEPLQGHTGPVYSVAFSANATKIVSGSWDNTIRIWDISTGQAIGEPIRGHTRSVNSVAFSGDDMLVASGSSDDTIRVWDAHTGQSIGQPLWGHTSWVTSVAFSSDGLHIVSGSGDKTIRIWNIQTFRAIGELDQRSPGKYRATNPAMFVVQEAGGGTASLDWDRPNLNPHGNWSLEKDGWVVIDDSRLLIWVPPDVQGTLLRPQNTIVISNTGLARLDFNDAYIGEQWRQCYHPARTSSIIMK